MERRKFVQLVSILGIGAVAGCGTDDVLTGGSSEGTAVSAAASGSTVTSASGKAGLLQAVQKFRDGLSANDPAPVHVAAVAVKLADLGFTEIVTDGLRIDAKFSDGFPVTIVFQNTFGLPLDPNTVLGTFEPLLPVVEEGVNPDPIQTVNPVPTSPREQLPAAGRAFVLEMFPTADQASHIVLSQFGGSEVDSTLSAKQLQNAGYSVTHLRSADIATLRGAPFNNGQIEVLVLFSHGNSGKFSSLGQNEVGPALPHVVATNQVVDFQRFNNLDFDAQLKDDILQNRVHLVNINTITDNLTTGVTLGLSRPSTWLLAITPAFVEKYWKFAPSSFMYDGCCFGSADLPWRQALFGAGLTRYLGWSQSVLNPLAHRAGRWLVDKMAGLNSYSPTANPPERPFDLDPCWARITNAELKGQPSEVDLTKSHFKEGDYVQDAVLGFFEPDTPNPDRFIGLVPTIASAQLKLEPSGQRRTLVKFAGTLAAANREVRFNGNPIPIFSEPDTFLLPDNIAGALQVVAGNRKSNKRAIHRWRFRMQATQFLGPNGFASESGQLFFTFHLQPEILLCLNKFRSQPASLPAEDFSGLLTNNTSCGLVEAGGSEVSGSKRYDLSLANGPQTLQYSFGPPSSQQASGTFGLGFDPTKILSDGLVGFNLGARVNNALLLTETNLQNGAVTQRFLHAVFESAGMRQIGTAAAPLNVPVDVSQMTFAGANFDDQGANGRRVSFNSAPREGTLQRDLDPRV